MTGSFRHEVRTIAGLFALLALLLLASLELAVVSGSAAARLGVLALAAAKVALVVAEYVEVRGAARWLVAVWCVWGVGAFVGLAVLAG